MVYWIPHQKPTSKAIALLREGRGASLKTHECCGVLVLQAFLITGTHFLESGIREKSYARLPFIQIMHLYYRLLINPGLYIIFFIISKPWSEKNMCSSGSKSSPAVPVDLIFNLTCLTVQTPEETLGRCCPVGGHLVWPAQILTRD